MTNFGTDRKQAIKDIRKLADALDQPVAMIKIKETYYGTPAGNLIGKDLSVIDYKIIKPKETIVNDNENA